MPWQSVIYVRDPSKVQNSQINKIRHISKDKNHVILSAHANKSFDKIQHPLMIKKKKNKLHKVDVEGTCFNKGYI